jgi:hypothetical protein
VRPAVSGRGRVDAVQSDEPAGECRAGLVGGEEPGVQAGECRRRRVGGEPGGASVEFDVTAVGQPVEDSAHVDEAPVEPVLSGPLDDGFQRGVVAVDDDVDRLGLGPGEVRLDGGVG